MVILYQLQQRAKTVTHAVAFCSIKREMNIYDIFYGYCFFFLHLIQSAGSFCFLTNESNKHKYFMEDTLYIIQCV